jgi:hypothetical protein
MKANVDLAARGRTRRFADPLAAYILIVLFVSLGSVVHSFRTTTIFACPADGYSADVYLAYCGGSHYADYEHGAFAFGLEPSAIEYAGQANVLFLGNSHMQVAFSTPATSGWFSARSTSYYLLGFSYSENMVFAEYLLPKVRAQAKVYVINVDDFFVRTQTSPVRTILYDPAARQRYEDKRLWQPVQQQVCMTFSALCGKESVIFRSRRTGAFTKRTARPDLVPVSYDDVIDQEVVKSSTAAAIDFLSHLPAQKACVILTTVPTVGTKIEDATAIARGAGLDLVTPGNLEGLKTYDGSHLDAQSAQLWSQAFFEIAGPRIRSCVEKQVAIKP